jgi:hypothetical protein
MKAGGALLREIAEQMTARGFPLSYTGVRRILDEWADEGEVQAVA